MVKQEMETLNHGAELSQVILALLQDLKISGLN